jgi:hypothetical protein
MKFAACCLSLALAAALLAGCGSSSSLGSGSTITPPVQAAAYSKASLTGTYGVRLTNTSISLGSLGTFSADGAGNISGGTVSEYFGGDSTLACPVTFTGTYTVDSTGNGSATITSTSGNCAESGTVQYALQVTQQGQTIFFVESDQQTGYAGTASRK